MTLGVSGNKKAGIAAKKATDITETMISVAEAYAKPLGVSAALHENDQLLGYFINKAKMAESAAAEGYITGGGHDASKVSRLIDRLGLANSPEKILEFASGFGRVTRHLKVVAPKNIHVASDIHRDACEFIQNELGVLSAPSDLDPAKLSVGSNYSLIFVLSLFSHLPPRTFGLWLKALYGIVKPGGYLMFTTHGQSATDFAPDHFGKFEYLEPGIAYGKDSDQPDIESADYGTTVVLPTYVSKTLASVVPDAKLVSFAAGEWFGIQDEWVIQKPKL